jgi:hypothetical protein
MLQIKDLGLPTGMPKKALSLFTKLSSNLEQAQS